MQYLAAKELRKESGYRGKMISYSKERGDDYVTVYRIKGYLVVYASIWKRPKRALIYYNLLRTAHPGLGMRLGGGRSTKVIPMYDGGDPGYM